MDWDASVRLEENRHDFTNLNSGYYTFRVRSICPVPEYEPEKPPLGPWGELCEPSRLVAGAVLKRGLQNVEVMEGETCRRSIEVSGEVRHPCWYLNGAKVCDDWISIEGPSSKNHL